MNVTLTANYQDSEISMPNADLEELAKLFEKRGQQMADKAILVHRKSVFQILVYAIRICNVATGRLRGAFTPFMRKYGYTNYQAYMAQRPMIGTGRDSGGRYKKGADAATFDQAAADAGAEQGSFIDQAMNTTISNDVAYAVYVDKKTGLLMRILDRGQQLYANNFRNFFDAVAKKDGGIPPVDPNQGGVEE